MYPSGPGGLCPGDAAGPRGDLHVTITPADVAAQTFPLAFRGYQVEAVDAFLDRLQGELTGGAPLPVRAPDPVPAQLPDPTDGGPAARALRTLVHAEQMAEQVLAEATAEAEEVRARAGVEAAAVLAAARAESGRVEAELRLRQEREVGALAEQAQQLRAEIDRLGSLEHRYADALRALLAEQQRLLEQRLPVLDTRPAAGSVNGHRAAA
jgi:cell division initiation protein